MSILAVSSVRGGTIDLSYQPSTTFREGKAGISAKVTNLGDSPAQDIQLEAFLAGHSALSQRQDLLESGESFSTTIDLGEPPKLPGIHNVVIKTRYRDENGYPLCVLRTVPLVTDMPLAGEEALTATLKATSLLRETGTFVLEIESRAETELEVGASLFVPDELGCMAPMQHVAIPSQGVARVYFHAVEQMTRPGLTYGVIAVLDTQISGQHLSYPVMGTISTPSFQTLVAKCRRWAVAAIVLALFLVIVFQFRQMPHAGKARQTVCDLSVLGVLLAFTLLHIDPHLIFLDTVTTGGDTPAHNYLAAHLSDQLLGHGRIVSWAGGWWCGFPMFQYYFPLPYLLVGIFDIALPFNIAFKLITVLGILALPSCIYMAARMLRTPHPIPVLAAIMSMPLLFDVRHTMWGVNINSTLAGMIASSISFPLMLLFVASAARDADDGLFRVRTVLLLVALLSSHFFTSIVGCVVVAMIPFFRPRAGFRQAIRILTIEGALGFLMMGWWIIPLILKQEYTVEFGVNWIVYFWKQSPPFLWGCAPFVLIGVGAAMVRRLMVVPLALAMLLLSLLLFFFGYDYVSHVFVNIRLWPFVMFSFLLLGAVGIGLVIRVLKFREAAVAAVLIGVLAFGVKHPNSIRTWARWNYSGLERTPNWEVISDLVLPLDGTPGRLANDLHEVNASLGSSRVFECVPFLVDKPILEGGILSSAATSLFSYYIQGETSKCTAGFPTRVKPTTFNFANATKHLELFNVKHFIARWGKTQQALAESKEWKFLAESKGWQLYELLSHTGSGVLVPPRHPQALAARDWKQAGLDWIYTPEALDQPFVLLSDGNVTNYPHRETWTDEEFHEYLANVSREDGSSISPTPAINETVVISEERITDNRISFRTSKPGLPHIIKCSYFPNWKTKDSTKVFRVTPNFMLVYPESEEVEIFYGYTHADIAGMLVSIIGVVALLVTVWTVQRR